MAAVIFHGPPGSYKTSSAIWFEMLTAFRNGRIVVTNIEGMKPLEEIEKELGEQFPQGAELWRLSTQKSEGLELMRSFYHWAPIGAQIIIDEVQDVFPVERNFRVEKYDYRPLQEYQGKIPDKWYQRHLQLLEEIKPDDLTSADIDDLEQVIFDDNGHIIYPTTLKESFMRHRKYNWDIVVATPDITQVNMLIRGACEAAFNHSSKDTIGKVIPYFKRRPRIRQHPSKENGLVPKKSDIITYRKVPKDVHKLYKSTATGAVTTSGVGKSPLQSGGFIFGALCMVGIVVYYALWFGGAFDASEENLEASATTGEKGDQVGTKDSRQNSGLSRSDGADEDTVQVDVYLKLPYEPEKVYLTSVHKVYEQGQYKGIKMTFELVTDSGKVYLDESTMQHYGITARYVADCFAKLIYQGSEQPVFCKPQEPKGPPEQRQVAQDYNRQIEIPSII